MKILFYISKSGEYIHALNIERKLNSNDIEKLNWLFDNSFLSEDNLIEGTFIGPRKEMVTPYSTNAVEITKNMGIEGIVRIELFKRVKENTSPNYDPMLEQVYNNLDQNIFKIEREPEPIKFIEDIEKYNEEEGLALSKEEIEYLKNISKELGRPLTDSEIYGFAQVNSEHSRHKIFNGKFIIDGKEMEESLFSLIKKTTKLNPNRVISAYKDNVAFIEGPKIEQFAPKTQETADFFEVKPIKTAVSLKAETHNFPTTVEPFYGASTGSGGEIRDRMAGGKGGIALAGSAVYMTAYPRLDSSKKWEKKIKERKWLYQTPKDILIKASNGASDFGNKFGQPLIVGSLLTFEHEENGKIYAYDKVVMLAGGVGFSKLEDSKKDDPEVGDKVVMMGGENYRIGMGGGAVSSVSTGEYQKTLELNAVQRANPEMQKRVYNAIRAMIEDDNNPIVSIHDHGAGGHLNCFSELLAEKGGRIDLDKLPIGDPTLSLKEIINNESQERMGLILKEKDIEKLKKVSERERAPLYIVGEVTGDKKLLFIDNRTGEKPIDLPLEYLFGKPPKTIIKDETIDLNFSEGIYNESLIEEYIENVLQLESVACKDWLTNKVDRSVTGKVAKQQTAGILQLPINNLGVVSLDYTGTKGVALSLGDRPIAGLINPESGSILSVAESLTNIVWAPIEDGLKGISLSANWMWPAKNKGEDSRLYRAVKALSEFVIKLGINVPTGKDSLSMTQKYPDGKVVYSPGTVIISAVGVVEDIKKVVEPVVYPDENTSLIYIDFSLDDFNLGGSAFYQTLNKIGKKAPNVDPEYFKTAFNTLQKLIKEEKILAGHDVSSGGLITTLLEMVFSHISVGMDLNLSELGDDIVKILFSEKPSVVIQVRNEDLKYIENTLNSNNIKFFKIGKIVNSSDELNIEFRDKLYTFSISYLRDIWYKPSYLLDMHQTQGNLSVKRYENYKKQPLELKFPDYFKGNPSQYNIYLNLKSSKKPKAAIIREKGINGDREMAWSLYYAGFDVKDIHMTDLISGRENLEDIQFLVFPGGFSNSDVLGSAKGWAGAFLYNEKAKKAIENFYSRDDTISLGVCNGCQLMVELGLIYPEHKNKPKMLWNDSHKFESAFISVEVLPNNSVMLSSLVGSKLGVWVAHGEGKFYFPYEEKKYKIPLKYVYKEYPGNPNGSMYNAAGIVSKNGRHLAMMPHLERAIFPWQWGYYPFDRRKDEITPWMEAFVNAREWAKKFL